MRVIDASTAGIGDKITVQAPSVGLGNRALKVAAKKWSWSQSGEDWVLDLPTSFEDLVSLLFELRRKIDAVLKTSQQVDKREVEE